MGQLIRATVIPLKTVHFSQPGRLVSSDSIDVERRKAIARHNAMRTNYAASTGTNDYRYLQEINQAFSRKTTPVQSDPTFQQHANVTGQAAKAPAPVSTVQNTQASQQLPNGNVHASADNSQYVPVSSGTSESEAAYAVQRGSFELRVAKGELSYLPALDMTIIVQYPSVEFEYLGDFNYVPPRDDDIYGKNIDFTT